MIVINLFPISAGGGLQNALSFMSFLAKSVSLEQNFIVFCREGSEIHSACTELGVQFKSFPAGFLGRIRYEVISAYVEARKNNVEMIFSLFGGPPLFSPGIYKISGFAYSNIVMPEIPFWGFLGPLGRVKRSIIDALRLFLAKRCNILIFETDYLAQRARQGIFKGKDIRVVKMSPSKLVLDGLRARVKEPGCKPWDILYLSGPHQNKRIHLMANIVDEINKTGARCRLVTTLPNSSRYFKQISSSFRELGRSDDLINIGPVSPRHVGDLLGRVDAVVNIALLESFSNNWVEAWATGNPLIVTDADWCRDSCGAGAIYIDPLNPRESALEICKYINNEDRLEGLVSSGYSMLSALPTPEARFNEYISIINEALIDRRGGHKADEISKNPTPGTNEADSFPD